MSKSIEREGPFGGKYTEHFDDDGNFIGKSEVKIGPLGGAYTAHTDLTGSPSGKSEQQTGPLGGSYTAHTGPTGGSTGKSEGRTGPLGGDYTAHFDASGRPAGTSERKRGPFGGKYTQHSGRSGPPYLAHERTPEGASGGHAGGNHNTATGTYSGSGVGGTGVSWWWGVLIVTALAGAAMWSGDEPAKTTEFRLAPGYVENRDAGLMMIRTPLGRFTKLEANQICNELSYGGYSDWRLPSATEMNAFGGAANALDVDRWDIFGGGNACAPHRYATYVYVTEATAHDDVVVYCHNGRYDRIRKNSKAAVLCVRYTQ